MARREVGRAGGPARAALARLRRRARTGRSKEVGFKLTQDTGTATAAGRIQLSGSKFRDTGCGRCETSVARIYGVTTKVKLNPPTRELLSSDWYAFALYL